MIQFLLLFPGIIVGIGALGAIIVCLKEGDIEAVIVCQIMTGIIFGVLFVLYNAVMTA